MNWKVNVTVNTEVESSEDVFTLRDDVETAANQSLDNAEVKFNPSMGADSWNAQIEILGTKKEAADLDDFATTIYNYFTNKFPSGKIALEYRRNEEWAATP